MTKICEALDREGMEKVNKDLWPFEDAGGEC
jgi:hypothetical protein